MQFLLDTHAFIWFAEGNHRLSARSRDAIENPENDIFLSIASVWEMAIKVGSGRLTLDQSVSEFVEDNLHLNGIEFLAIHPVHIFGLSELPHLHRDPFDWMLISQCRAEKLQIVSVDSMLDRYGLDRFW